MFEFSKPVEDADLVVLSLGAGVQSSAMALMAAHGEITPMPDCAIFADTQWESQEVYDYVDFLNSGNALPFPIYAATAGDLREHALSGVNNTDGAGHGTEFCGVPFHTKDGIGRRQCTRYYKVAVVKKKIREILGLEKGQRALGKYVVEQWIGISMDERERMADAHDKWIKNRWPLLEKGITRRDCKEWTRRHNYPAAPRSACLNCPFKTNEEWRHTRDNCPDEWEQACADDLIIRNSGTTGEQFSHFDKVPLHLADLAGDSNQMELFECEGMCGM